MTIDTPAVLGTHLAPLTWRSPQDADPASLRAALRAGGRAVLLIDATAVPTLAGQLADRELPVPELIGRPDDADPLVLDTHLRAVAADGSALACDGWADLSELRDAWTGAEVLARVGDLPAVLSGAFGGGTLLVVGTAHLADDRWLPVAGNASFLAWALTGAPDAGAADRVKGAPAGDPTLPHPAVPVVTAGAAGAASELVAAAPAPGTALDGEPFLAAVRHAARLLPPAVHDALVDFADHSSKAGALLVRGLPVGEVPPTPLVPGAAEKDRISEFVLLTVGRRLGHPIGYLPEHGGRIVQDLSPTPDAVTRQTSTSSGVELAFHTETAFHPHRPRYLLLLCLRGDTAARTTLCSVHAALQHLTRGEVAILREARFRTGVDESFVGGRSEALGRLVPVLAGTDDAPTLTFDADLMVGDDAEAQAALDALSSAVARAKIGVTLASGDLLVVDNQVAVHGRSPFRARFDGTDRWLQRTFVVPDLTASAADRTGRIVTTRFVR